jgi:hypothetical protein
MVSRGRCCPSGLPPFSGGILPTVVSDRKEQTRSTSGGAEPNGQRPFTRDDFFRDLKKAAKRTEPQKDPKPSRSGSRKR